MLNYGFFYSVILYCNITRNNSEIYGMFYIMVLMTALLQLQVCASLGTTRREKAYFHACFKCKKKHFPVSKFYEESEYRYLFNLPHNRCLSACGGGRGGCKFTRTAGGRGAMKNNALRMVPCTTGFWARTVHTHLPHLPQTLFLEFYFKQISRTAVFACFG